ncbi:hypothetical protein MKFW12EY_29310 [Methylomonas koyamae]|nr:hypothetical protein MKFW12EY_29310 [Methylomonas koyamae]
MGGLFYCSLIQNTAKRIYPRFACSSVKFATFARFEPIPAVKFCLDANTPAFFQFAVAGVEIAGTVFDEERAEYPKFAFAGVDIGAQLAVGSEFALNAVAQGDRA